MKDFILSILPDHHSEIGEYLSAILNWGEYHDIESGHIINVMSQYVPDSWKHLPTTLYKSTNSFELTRGYYYSFGNTYDSVLPYYSPNKRDISFVYNSIISIQSNELDIDVIANFDPIGQFVCNVVSRLRDNRKTIIESLEEQGVDRSLAIGISAANIWLKHDINSQEIIVKSKYYIFDSRISIMLVL